MKVEKSDLLVRSDNIYQMFLIGFYTAAKISKGEVGPQRPGRVYITVGSGVTIPIDGMYETFSEKRYTSVASEQFFILIGRGCITALFEYIKEYCKNTSQLAKFKKVTWYHFARLVRNVSAHAGKLNFRDHDKKILPVEWQSKNKTYTIDISMEGKELPINTEDFLELLSQMKEFVIKELN